jgi:hypothetical protein
MKPFSSYVLSSLVLGEKCQFNHTCKLYSNSSHTCTHVGGEYCGKYRILSQKSGKDRNGQQNLRVEKLIIA